MSALLRNLLIALVISLVAVPAAAQSGSVTGRVTAAAGGQPISGARVEAAVGGRIAGTATTDDNGQFRISNLPEGSYTLSVARIGYQLHRIEGLAVGIGIVTADVAMTPIPSILDQVVTTASRAPEKILDAPASVSVVNEKEINERPSITVTDHIATLPGIDVARGGLMQANVVARGFNNIFSGALLTLTDNRFAYVPSLRVNIPYLIPTNNEDIEHTPREQDRCPGTSTDFVHGFTTGREHTGSSKPCQATTRHWVGVTFVRRGVVPPD